MSSPAAGTPAAPTPEPTYSGGRLVLMTFALILAPLVQVFDTSVVSIALTQMQGSLSATQDQIAWVLTSYLIAITITTPLWGALGGRFGRKPLLLVSIAGFTVFSLFAGSSQSLEEVLVHRFFQGVFGSALIPLALSSLLSIYKREDFSIAMGWWGVGIMFGPVFGPTLGGYIAEYYSWRWAFYLNLPLGLLAFCMVALLVPRPGVRSSRPFNYFGFIMLAVSVGCLQFILDRGNRMDWFDSPTIITLSLISAAALWLFLVNSWTSKTPFIDPGLFLDRNYLAGTVLRVLFGAVLFGSLVLLPPFLQKQGGYSLIDSAWILAPRGLGSMLGSMFIGRLIQTIDPRKMMGCGMALTAYTMYALSTFTNDIDLTAVTIICFFQGLAFSMFVIPVNTVAFSTLSPERRDLGTSFYSLLNNIGRNLGIAVLVTYFTYQVQASRSVLRDNINPFNDAFRHGLIPDAWGAANPAGLSALNRVMAREADLIAYVADFRVLAIAILVCLPIVFIMNNPHAQKKADAAAG
ncbi:MAG: DHA2 family multidrug resistance protein [Alphaproteobacteria bacterium]|jgi:DHA2 family multidrug resistance protein